MKIENLQFIGHLNEERTVVGRAGTTVTSYALALGESAVTQTIAKSTAKALPNGGALSIAIGRGVAQGTKTTALVETAGQGDIVVGSTHSTPDLDAKPVDIAHGVVVAIDLPTYH